jgi:mono/diheme cytochrome c family protein
VQQSSKFMAQRKLRWGWLVLGAMVALIGTLLDATGAQAQNLDQGKSATRLFADSCATCHRSPRGLAKGRSRSTLFAFLNEHYSTSSDTAGELASYLASVDTPQSSRSRAAAGKPSRPAKPRRAAGPPLPSTQSN